MNKLEKTASIDAQRWAAAEMFYGEGAGTRRKLLDAELGDKVKNIEGYDKLFWDAYESLDMNKIALAAVKERKALDRAAKASRNFRAIKSGNLNNLTSGLFIVGAVGLVAHQTGYDKVAWAEAKRLYKKAKVEVKFRKARREGRNVEKIYG